MVVGKTPLTLNILYSVSRKKMSKRHFFLGDLVLLFLNVAWGSPYGFSGFVTEISSRRFLQLMLITVSKSVRGHVCLKI